MCRKERGCFPGWSAFRGQGGRKRCAPGRCAVGPGGVAVWPWFPTPHTGQSERESSLIGSLAVSFTLNIKVKQTSQASLCWQRRGEPSPAESGVLGPWSSMSGDSFPSLPLPQALWRPSPACGRRLTLRHRFYVARAGAPFAGPARAQVSITPTQTAPLRKQTNKCMGKEKTPTPKSQTSSSCPILFSRLKNKIQTIGEQRSRAALGSTRTKGLCTTIR